MTALPPAIEALDPRTLLGRWHIVATTLGFWRGRSDATVTYAERADGRWSDTLAYRSGAKARTLVGVDTPHAHGPGFFGWRGAGWLVWCTSTWGFVRVDPAGRWAVTWFSRATLGVTPEGMDVYAREPLPEAEVQRILEDVRADAALPKLDGWFSIPRST